MTDKVDWSKAPEGATFYANGKFWVKSGDSLCYRCDNSWVFMPHGYNLKQFKDYQELPQPITEIRIGDYIHKDELDTEEKYNDVVRVFERFGFGRLNDTDQVAGSTYYLKYTNLVAFGSLLLGDSGRQCTGRQLTYDQIMSLDKTEHIDVDNCNVDKMVTGCDFARGGVSDFSLEVNVPNGFKASSKWDHENKVITVDIGKSCEFKTTGKEAGCEDVGTPYHPELYIEDLNGRNAKAKDEDMESLKEAIAGIDDFEFDISPFNPSYAKREKLRRKIRRAVKDAQKDQVKSPSHYQLIEGVESIEIIARSMTQAEWKGFCLGNMLKYRIRAGKKDSLQQDIDKANFYGELYEMHKGKCYDS
jgi:hypothetical protein